MLGRNCCFKGTYHNLHIFIQVERFMLFTLMFLLPHGQNEGWSYALHIPKSEIATAVHFDPYIDTSQALVQSYKVNYETRPKPIPDIFTKRPWTLAETATLLENFRLLPVDIYSVVQVLLRNNLWPSTRIHLS